MTTRTEQQQRRYRKKPVVVEAVRWMGDNEDELLDFTGYRVFNTIAPEDREGDVERTAEVWDDLHNTWVAVYTGQWVIKGVKGEFYPCADDVFEATYEPVTNVGLGVALDAIRSQDVRIELEDDPS
jgi:hypothetical protein